MSDKEPFINLKLLINILLQKAKKACYFIYCCSYHNFFLWIQFNVHTCTYNNTYLMYKKIIIQPNT